MNAYNVYGTWLGINTNDIEIRADFSDTGSGIDIASCEWQDRSWYFRADKDTNGWRTDAGVHWVGDSVSGYCTAIVGTNGDEDNQNIRLRVKDNAGNISIAPYFFGNTDGTAPTTSANAPSGWQKASDVTITLTPADAKSGVASTSYCVDHTNSCTPGTAYTTPFLVGGQGDWYVRYFSTDNVGNVQTVVSKHVQIDNTNPSISFADDVDSGPTQSDTVTINVSDTNLSSYHYAFSSNDSCGVDYTGSFTSGSAITFSDESRNGQWICVKASDSAGNDAYLHSANSLNIDVTPPQLISAKTKDTNGNGKIDAIDLTFNEAINDSMLTTGADGWDVADYSGESIETGSNVNDNILHLSFNEGSGPDSGNKPTVTYTQDLTPPAESTHDIAGNELVSGSWPTTDEAKPVVLSAETQDVNGNGKIDNIKLTFSENIDDDRLQVGTADGWDVVGYDGESIGTGSAGNDNVLLLGFTEGASYDVNTTPAIAYIEQELPTSTHDIAGNQLNDYSATTTDKSAPTKSTANPIGGGYYADQSVSLTDESEADIRYTTNGTNPSASSTQYIGTPILINHSQTLKAVAIDPSGNVSPVMTEEYGIAPIISFESIVNSTSGTPGTEQVITWDTDDLSTSRVVYGLESVSTLGSSPNYGYQHSTDTFNLAPDKVTHHVVTLTGLQPDKVYYYRVISAGSPENISAEMDFKTGTDHETADSSGSGQSTSPSTTTKLATTVSKVLGTTIAQITTPITKSTTSIAVGNNGVATNSSDSSSSQPEKVTPEKGTVEAAATEATPTPAPTGNNQKGTQIKWWWYLIALVVIMVAVYYFRNKNKIKPEQK